jgi:hypothetical protein
LRVHALASYVGCTGSQQLVRRRCALQHELAHASRIGLAVHRLQGGTDDSSGGLHFFVADPLEDVWSLCKRRIDRCDEASVV